MPFWPLGADYVPSPLYHWLGSDSRTVLDALADIDARLTASIGDAGMVGAGLRRWRTGLANRAAQAVNLVVCGDSISGGWVAGTRQAGYVQVLADRLCAALGQPGGHPRYLPCAKDHGSPATVFVYGEPWTHAGTTYEVNQQFGLGRLGTWMPTGAGNGASTTQTCDRITLLYPTATSLVGSLEVRIDGATVATLNQIGGTYRSSVAWQSALMDYKAHTLEVVPTVLGCNIEGAYFHQGDHTTGLRVWNGGKPTASTYHFFQEIGGVAWCDGMADSVPPDLVILELGSNDVYWPFLNPAATQQDLEDTVALINTAAGYEPSILFLVAPRNAFEDADSEWDKKVRRPIWKAAQAYPAQACVFDAWELMGEDASLLSPVYGDSVHPNPLGHAMLGEALAQYLLTDVPLAAGIDGGNA